MPRAPDLAGHTLEGRYELLELIGEGTFGRVYRGRDRRLGRTVAVKVIKPWWAEDPVWVRRFAREAQLLASLSNPGIVQIYDVGEADEGLYYVAELVDGNSLAQRLRRGPMSPDSAAAVGEQLCRALGRAHEQGIVHRDVKPANILLSRDGTLKVGDFGVARLTQSGTNAASATVIGTPQYMSPEQARGERTSAASDVYGAGIVLYEMLAGQPPFVGDAAVMVALHHLRDAPPPLPDEIPESLRAIVERAIAKDPTERYRDGTEMADALAAAHDGRAVPEAARRRPRRSRSLRESSGGTAAGPMVPRRPARPPATAPSAGSRGTQTTTVLDRGTRADATATAVTERLAEPAEPATGTLAPAPSEPESAAPTAPAIRRRPPPAGPAATLIDAPAGDRRPRRRRRRARRGAVLVVALVAAGGAVAFLATRPGHTTVPHFVGLHRHTIARVADRDHLQARFETRFASEPRGVAFSQRPESGQQVSVGTPVTVLISDGPQPVTVPNVIGDGASQASVALRAAGLYANVTTVPAPGVAPGTVTGEQPTPPATAAPGSTIAVQEAEVPSWHTVTTLSGSDDDQSVPFRIRGNRWQVTYNMNYQGTCTFFVICFGPHLSVQNVSTGSTVKSLGLSSGNNNTQGFQTGPGVYQLAVSAGEDSAAWSITVQDLY